MNMGRIGRWADRVVVREYGYDVLKGEEKDNGYEKVLE